MIVNRPVDKPKFFVIEEIKQPVFDISDGVENMINTHLSPETLEAYRQALFNGKINFGKPFEEYENKNATYVKWKQL